MEGYLEGVPEDRRHTLICKQSGGALFPTDSGIQPVIFIRCEMLAWNEKRELNGEDHFIMIPLKDAIVLKRSIERTLAEVEQKDPTTIYQERTN